MDNDDTKMIEIVGVEDGECGQSCSIHRSVKIVNESGMLEVVMAVNSMPDNLNEMCRVGFINRVFFEDHNS